MAPTCDTSTITLTPQPDPLGPVRAKYDRGRWVVDGNSNIQVSNNVRVHNGPTLHGKLRAPNNRIGRLLAKKAPGRAILEELYLATLSRPPDPEDVKAALEAVAKAKNKREAWEDIQWALLNSKEFLFRH